MLRAIREKAQNAEIVLMGYAPLFESGAVCENAGISRDEVDWLNAAAVRLRDVHRAAVAQVARADPR